MVATYDHLIGAATMGAWMKARLSKLVAALESRLGPVEVKPAKRKTTGKKPTASVLLAEVHSLGIASSPGRSHKSSAAR